MAANGSAREGIHRTGPPGAEGSSPWVRRLLTVGGLLALLPGAALAANLTLTGGTTQTVPAGGLDLDCGNVLIQSGATLNGGTGTLALGGDWNNQGTFNRGTGTVAITDQDCAPGAVSTLSGTTYFHNLTGGTANGHALVFESGQQQSVANNLELRGASGNRLVIRSTTPGIEAFLHLDESGTQSIDWVDVQDNHAPITGQHLALGLPSAFNSVDGGNNFRWFLNIPAGGAVQGIPTLSQLGLLVLVMVLALAAFHHRRTDGPIRLR